MNVKDYFPYDVDPNLISVYIGRVVSLDPEFSTNGILYVDLFDIDSTDIDQGIRQSNQAKASFAVRSCYNAWENPPEIKSKTQFDGAMNFTSSGDFHLQNYCFDMQTLAWFTTVSTALNALGIVNVPPVMVSLDTTPFPGKAVSVNVSVAAKEVVNESIDASIKDLETEETPISPEIKSESEVSTYINTHTEETYTEDTNDPVIKVVGNVYYPIQNILNQAVKPYTDFIKCIDILLDLYSNTLTNIENITFPITQFSQINDDGTATIPDPLSSLAIKESIQEKINAFHEEIMVRLDSGVSLSDEVIKLIYNPVANMYMMVDSKVQDVITPIKKKVVELISTYVKEPLSQLTGLIAMSIQPVISSLPTIVQIIVKLALKKLLQILVGTPIKTILKSVIEPIEDLLENIIDSIEDMVGEVISTSINTLINPVIEEIQNALIVKIPDFGMSKLVEELEKIRDDSNYEFPKIYIGKDPSKPFKTFEEIDWSNPEELKAMLISLIDSIDKEQPSVDTKIQKVVDSIYFYEKDGVVEIQGADQKCNSLIRIMDMDGNDPEIQEGDPLKEGTIINNSSGSSVKEGELYYRKFSSKEEFLPYFESMHPIVLVDAEVGLEGTIFEKVNPQIWLTNGVAYLDIPDGDSIIRYITYCSIDGVYYGAPTVEIEKGILVSLELNKVYYSKTIPHIQSNDNNPPVGEDLIPRDIEFIDGVYKANVVQIPKTVKATRTRSELSENKNIGDILYYDTDGIEEKTFSQLASKYYQVPVTTEIPLTTLLFNLKQILNRDIDWSTVSWESLYGNSNPWNTDPVALSFKETLLYQCLLKINTYSVNIIEIKDDERIKRDPNIKDSSFILKKLFDKVIVSVNTKPSGTLIVGEDINIEIECSLSNNKISSCALTVIKVPVTYKISDIPPVTGTKWPENNNAEIKGSVLDTTSTEYYSWMVSKLEEHTLDSDHIHFLMDHDAVIDQLSTMLVHTVQAIGQDEGFNASSLYNSIENKSLSEFGKIADAVSGVDSILSSTLERIDEFKNIDSSLEKLGEIKDTVQKVADTAGPALEATANAASAVALQSCSMTQSSKGKDFSFNSGDGYDLSTTTEARSQLPWCKELNREQFLEPNCKVLLMAVGAGKSNLYVIDILT